MTGAIWVLLMTGGVAALLAAVSRRRFEEWAAPAVFLLTGVIYVFALAGAPALGCRVAQAIGLACLAAAAVLSLRQPKALVRVLTPGTMAFGVVVLIAWWAHRGQLYVRYDDLTHWGRMVNRLYALGTLPQAVSGLLAYPSYPPGATLWEYLWLYLDGVFSEGRTLSANNVMIIVCFLPLMRHVSWKRWIWFLPLLLICLMLPIVFYEDGYQDIYVDVLLGAIASYALMQWFTLPHGWEQRTMVGTAMLALSLVKESGTSIALLLMAVMALDVRGRGRGIRRFAPLGAPLACLAAGCLSWKIYLGVNGIAGEKPFRYWEIGENLSMLLRGESPWHQRYLFSNFFRYLTMPQMMGEGHILQLCYLEWLMIFALIACWLGRRKDAEGHLCKNARRYGWAAWIMLAFTAVYAVALTQLYLYAFQASEAASLHSFDRYMATAMIPALALMAALTLESWRLDPPRVIPVALAVLAGLMLVVNPSELMTLTFTAPLKVESTQSVRAAYYPPAWELDKLSGNERVAWLTCGRNDEDSTFTYEVNRYEFLPVALENPCGVQLEEAPEDVAAALAEGGYEYAYCFDVDETFAEEYGSLFGAPEQIADKTLYRVVEGPGGVRLVPA